MDTTTLGRTGLTVSVAGLGCGGFSRLGMSTGGTRDEAVALVRLAIDSGITFIDTAAQYGTEDIVGEALRDAGRSGIVIATKSQISEGGKFLPVEAIVTSLDASLRRLGIDCVDVFQLHGIAPEEYDHAMNAVVPALLRERERGKFRFLGITEAGARDQQHELLIRAATDGIWDVGMVAYNMLHRTAADRLFPLAIEGGMGMLGMHAVRSIFARPDFLAAAIRERVASGQVPAELLDSAAPLDFLVHPGGAESITDAAYRFVRHTPGVSVVLFGTGSAAHLTSNIASINRPALPEADVGRLLALFGAVSGLGLENPGAKT